MRSRPANSAPSSSAAMSAMPRPAAACSASCSALRLPDARKSASIAEMFPAQLPSSSASPSAIAAAAAIAQAMPRCISCTSSAAASATAYAPAQPISNPIARTATKAAQPAINAAVSARHAARRTRFNLSMKEIQNLSKCIPNQTANSASPTGAGDGALRGASTPSCAQGSAVSTCTPDIFSRSSISSASSLGASVTQISFT